MSETQSDAGAGWVTFAGIILIAVGFFQAFIGLVGLLEDEVLVVTPDYVAQLDATTWGWVHMIIGLIVLAASPHGRLLLLIMVTSLVPFAFTWKVDPNWRFTVHAYPFLLIAAAVGVGAAATIVRALLVPRPAAPPV